MPNQSKSYYNMSRPAEITQFYGVDVSDYSIHPLKNRDLITKDQRNVNINNAHIYALAYQAGFDAPSEHRIAKTSLKNNAAELTVNRLERAFRNYRHNPFQQIFKKPKRTMPKARTANTNKREAFQVQSPEQIVIKCARQAYARQILAKEKRGLVIEPKVLSQAEIKRRHSQKMRRIQRTLIIKAYKYQLFAIFGSAIYTMGWRISREQLKEKLQLPAESYNINFMKSILMERYAKASLDREIFLQKKKKYQQERMQRWKKLKAMRSYQKKLFIPHSQISYPHKEEELYEVKREHQIKSKESRKDGERMKKMKKRKMKKQKIWYRGNEQPNSKEIQKQVDETTIDLQQIEEDEEDAFDQPEQVVNIEQLQKESNSTH